MPLSGEAITNGSITTWLDAQRQYVDIAQRPRPALHAVTRVATAIATTAPRAAAGLALAAVAAVVAGQSVVQGRAGSSVSYTPAQVASLTQVREAVEKEAAAKPDLRDGFLCHAWDDRQGAAKELHDLLEAASVKVWFSEKDLGLGVPMMRAIDKSLAASKIGLVLVISP